MILNHACLMLPYPQKLSKALDTIWTQSMGTGRGSLILGSGKDSKILRFSCSETLKHMFIVKLCTQFSAIPGTWECWDQITLSLESQHAKTLKTASVAWLHMRFSEPPVHRGQGPRARIEKSVLN